MNESSMSRALISCMALLVPGLAQAQGAAPAAAPSTTCQPGGAMGASAAYKSVQAEPDGRLTFRLCAPDASTVTVVSPDMPDVIPFGGGLVLSRDASGMWSGTTAKPVAPDNYRYHFAVNGVAVADPQAVTFSRQRVGTQSTVEVRGAGSAFHDFDPKIAHGVVSEVEYWSASLGQKRRAHVYTPPGYFRSSARYPVLYLVHGAGDSDDNWTSTGHAHYILDNLIAAGKAKPMIIVMPFGHTPERAGENILENSDFGNDLINDLIPFVDREFRTQHRAGQRAMAGLSMGGAHTIRNGLTHPELFRYVGIFSMGLGMSRDQADVKAFEQQHADALARSAKAMKLVYYAMGKDDFLYNTVAPTRALLDRQGIRHVYNETSGGHTWINWRRYLLDFLPRLF